ncbi:tumor necrosis factor receptor superfamily member 27 isoform X1 [Acinonyx jubatus]|uniref:exodeoxyribonuclease III n=1 Tax=Acinonyx jubatus TaxID=32536 RepID=A0ABM3NG18_ACIJB|nr:tumor necrosis factor receptor superfamily member 27 isoform X1 [Acinonyx jubatus]XP_053058382.1 tumor necrosis factor receptor superfamily member 27 isoform X1 [Acinonyx jubatus]
MSTGTNGDSVPPANCVDLDKNSPRITLNVNGLNALAKRHRVSEWIKKKDPSICPLQETHFRPEDTFRLRVRGWRIIYHATGSQKNTGVAILISDKLDFQLKAVTRDEEGHYTIITGSIHQEELTIINVYAPNTRAPKYIKQLITNRNNIMDKNVVIAGDFNTPLTEMDRSSRHTVNKDTRALNDTLDQMDLKDI